MFREGKYIVIEGADGTGKSTIVEGLKKYYENINRKVLIVHEPGGNEAADEIRKIVKNGKIKKEPMTNLLLFTASRVESWKTIIKPALEKGKIVISSRNWYSSWVYQGFAEKLGTEIVEDITRKTLPATYVIPDKVIILTLDKKSRDFRIKNRDESYKTDAFEMRDCKFQNKLNQGYDKLIKHFNLIKIDSSQTKEEVLKEVIKKL